ncbi:hypothetical protein POJ06DRAFT_207434 [Lipomyces tetrasporus]|uniref:NAD(P)-binding protein n=1 Tax=Lipomyces tetrasporus TaxID=54092 RepID=A0AAD7VUL7_9ASCO|nr:uncharacterized protein POJ06DRAFT_207434 [Lipomyces tetrasporus]KAJ8101964.1 hypothetical protein POJ06DRAFT_207434 [Lipomyces tetrasporus]
MDRIKSMISLRSEFRPPPAAFTEKDMPDLTGKVFLVTGGSSGVGLELCRILYHRGGRVIVGGRSEKAFLSAADNVKANPATGLGGSPKGSLEFLYIDLSDLATVKPAAQELLSKINRLDVVWYNAGVMIPPVGSKTKQGYELQWGTNVVAHFLLNRFLSPLQIKTAESAPESSVRTIWISSAAHHEGPEPYGINFGDINYEHCNKKPDPMLTYAQSKAGDVLCAFEYAKQVSDKGIVSLSLNPGFLRTNLQRNFGLILRKTVLRLMLFPARLGALTELYAGFASELTAKKGFVYIIPWGRIGPLNKRVRLGLEEHGTSQKLWAILAKETDKYM